MTATERVLFALAANRALAPSSKLAAAEWITNDVHIDGLTEAGEQTCSHELRTPLAVRRRVVHAFGGGHGGAVGVRGE